jgi:hypothetical protein
LNTDRPALNKRVHWIGAGTKDTGFSLTRLTYQITHATDSDTNAERDYIVAELDKHRQIQDLKIISNRSAFTSRTHINHYN